MNIEDSFLKNPEKLTVAISSSIEYTTGTIKSVSNVEVINPPITACPIGARNSAPSPSASATGSIPKITLDLTGKAPGMDESKFKELAKKAKEDCPLSKLLNATIELNTTFVK